METTSCHITQRLSCLDALFFCHVGGSEESAFGVIYSISKNAFLGTPSFTLGFRFRGFRGVPGLPFSSFFGALAVPGLLRGRFLVPCSEAAGASLCLGCIVYVGQCLFGDQPDLA